MHVASTLKSGSVPVSIEFVKGLFGSSLPDSPVFSAPCGLATEVAAARKDSSPAVKA